MLTLRHHSLAAAILPCIACIALVLSGTAIAAGPEHTDKAPDLIGTLRASTEKPISGRRNNQSVRPVTGNDRGAGRGGGDTCASATVISSLPFTDTGSTAGMTDNYNEACPYTAVGAPDVVYAFTPASDMFLDIDLCASLYDTKVYVYEGKCPNEGNALACNDDACGGDGYKSQLLSMSVFAGITYYIVIDGYDAGTFGAYTLHVAEGAAPPVCNPGAIFAQNPNTPLDNWAFQPSDDHFISGALLSQEDIAVGGAVTSLTFWGIQAVNTGGGYITCDESPVALQIIFYEDDLGIPGDPICTYNVNATPMPTGIIFNVYELDRYEVTLPSSCTVGFGWISIQGTANPNCWFLWAAESPGVLAGTSLSNGNPVPFDLSLCLSGTPQNGACCVESAGTCMENVSLDNCITAGGDRFLPGASCASFNPACGAFPTGACCLPGECTEVPEGTCVAMGGAYSGNGTTCAGVTCIPVNDTCENAIPVITRTAVMGSTMLAGDDETPNCGEDARGSVASSFAEVWYSIIGDGTTIILETCNSTTDFDTKIQVFVGCDTLTCVAGNDDTLTADSDCALGGGVLWKSSVSFCSEPGVLYLIAVGGHSQVTRGTFLLAIDTDEIQCAAPVGRCCFGGEPSNCPADISNNGSAGEDGIVNLFDLLELLSQWGSDGTADIASSAGPGGEGVVNLFDLLELLANWGACAPRGVANQCAETTASGCADFAGAFRAGAACDNECPVGLSALDIDTCAAARVVPAAGASYEVNTVAATNDLPTGACNSVPGTGMDNSVWWTYTAAQNGTLTITHDPRNYDGLTAVYAGSCASLTELACLDEPEPGTGSIPVTAGVTYYIQSGDWGTSDGGGDLEVRISFTP